MKRYAGVVTAVVKSLKDPDGEGKILVEFPWMSADGQKSALAPIASIMAGKDRGAYFMPEPEDEVLVAFEHGDFNHPFIVGFLWNGADRPPATDPRLRLLRTLNGHEIAIYDPDVNGGDMGYIRIKDAHGNVIELSNAQITIRSIANITIEAPNVTINGRPVAPVGPPI
jgi:uncharacterized protein involved in type VI secretion and phage assembly